MNNLEGKVPGNESLIGSVYGNETLDGGVAVGDVFYNGIETIKQTVTSNEDDGINEITTYLTDGSKEVFQIKNGSKGSQGIQGPKGDKGDKGDVGPQGEQGVQGPQGEQGPQGIQGEKGNTGSQGVGITMIEQTTTTTTSSGRNVLTIRLSSGKTTEFSVFNGMRGETGAQGDKGDKGDTGEQGIQGIQGERGLQGEKGADGYTPKKGVDYFDGTNGKDGVSATHSWNGTVLSITSASGTTSADLKGAKGDKGDTGATGPQGSQGIQGPKGDKGDKGDNGSDANVTKTNVVNALGYTPLQSNDLCEFIVNVTTGSGSSNLVADKTRSEIAIALRNGKNCSLLYDKVRYDFKEIISLDDGIVFQYVSINDLGQITRYTITIFNDGSSDYIELDSVAIKEAPTVVQTSGYSLTSVMSQKAVTDYINSLIADDNSGYETVNSVNEMIDTNKSYILSTTGTLWSYLPTEVLEPKTTSVPIKSTTDNTAVNGARLTSTKSANYVSSGTGYVTSPYIFLDDYAGKGEITLRMGGDKQWIYSKSTEAPSYARILMTDSNNDSIALISNVSPNATWKDDSTKTTTFNGTEALVKINLPYYYNSKEVKRMRFSTSASAWADGDIKVEYTDYEKVMGESEWQDTGLAVAEITEYSLANGSVKNFMEKIVYTNDDSYSKTSITTYCGNENYRKDYPLPVTLTWEEDRMAVDYAVALTEITNGTTETHYATTNRLSIYNLKPNIAYRYKVTALMCNGIAKVVKEGNFTTLAGTRMLKIDGIQNVRDVGGYVGQDNKKVKYGLIYRGSAMDEEIPRHLCISEVGKREMLMLGIGTDLDLRYGHTSSPLGVDFINTSSGYDDYEECFTVKSQRTNFANLLTSIVTQLTNNKPVYIHCQGGCDRTGTLVFQLLGLLGVSESDLAKEYELSSFSPIGYTRTRNSEKYSVMISKVNAYSGTTIADKIYSFATKSNDDTETGGCGISADTIASFRELMLG